MTEKKDYYAILEVSKDATEDEIRKKYRSLAKKFHPDKWTNGSESEKKEAEQKFKDIAEAYEVLSDPQKRQMYDNGGFEFDTNGFDPFEMFRNMTGGGFGSMFGDLGGMFGNMGGGRQVSRGSNIQTNISLPSPRLPAYRRLQPYRRHCAYHPTDPYSTRELHNR